MYGEGLVANLDKLLGLVRAQSGNGLGQEEDSLLSLVVKFVNGDDLRVELVDGMIAFHHFGDDKGGLLCQERGEGEFEDRGPIRKVVEKGRSLDVEACCQATHRALNSVLSEEIHRVIADFLPFLYVDWASHNLTYCQVTGLLTVRQGITWVSFWGGGIGLVLRFGRSFSGLALEFEASKVLGGTVERWSYPPSRLSVS